MITIKATNISTISILIISILAALYFQDLKILNAGLIASAIMYLVYIFAAIVYLIIRRKK